MRNIQKFWIEIIVAFGLLCSLFAPVGYAEFLRVVPNVASDKPGFIGDKSTQLGQLEGDSKPSDIPHRRQQAGISGLAIHPCPRNLSPPPLPEKVQPLELGCEFSKEPSQQDQMPPETNSSGNAQPPEPHLKTIAPPRFTQ